MLLFFILAGCLLVVDIVTKILTAGGASFDLIKGVISVFPWQNRGAAFGIFQGGGIWLILATTALIGLITAFYVRYKRKTRFLNISFAFFFAGAVGNLLDRVFLGYVRDFIRFDVIDWFVGLFSPGYQFPICNMADVFLNVSVVLLAIYFIFLYKDGTAKKELAAPAEKASKSEGVDEQPE